MKSIELNIRFFYTDFNENERQLIIGYSNRMIRVFNSTINEELDGRISGRFILKHVFNIAEHFHTLSSRRISTKEYELVVSQPGGNLLRFNPNDENSKADNMYEQTDNLTCSDRTTASDVCIYGTAGWTEAIGVDQFNDDAVYATISNGKQNFNRNPIKRICLEHIDLFGSQLNKTVNSIQLSVKTGYLCGLQKGSMTVIRIY